jgi:predicted dehydrogenase
VRVGQVGFGPWGQNVARNFADLSELVWVCDVKTEQREHAASQHPEARWTKRFEDLLEDRELDAIAVATDVPSHYPLAKQALEAGKHVFVEKPPAMRGAEMDELVALSEQRDLVLMPGHLLLYHPGVKKLKELISSGELGEVLYVYGNRQNFGVIRTVENALWSLGVHDLSVILYLLDEEPENVIALGRDFLQPGVEDVVFCYLRFPSGKVAHMHLSWLDPHKMRRMTVVGKEKMVVFDDMKPEDKVTIYENAPEKPGENYPTWRTHAGDVSSPDVASDEPLRLECEHFLALVRGEGDRQQVARDGAMVVRALERLTESLRGS